MTHAPSIKVTRFSAALLSIVQAGHTCAGVGPYNFNEVTTLAQGSLVGVNVADPVPGFELRLLYRGRVVYSRAFGNFTIGRVANADSSTKTISGAVIVSVIATSPNLPRPFTLATKLSDYIPAFNGAKRNITIQQAFSHTAGFPGLTTAESNQSISLQQAAVQIAGEPLRYLPGINFSYTGIGMHAAGAAAELATGTAWNTLFAQRLAVPLGLTATRFVLTSPSNPRIAGGCESNAEEFSRFMETLRRGGIYDGPSGPVRVLSQSAVDMMFTRQSPAGLPIAFTPLTGVSDYGVGVWLDQRDAGGNLIGAIAGGARGFCCWIDFDDEMVGCISTDLTRFSNIETLQYLIRAAAEQAIRNPACPADVTGALPGPGPDGVVDGGDFTAFINSFAAGDVAADATADIVDGGGTPPGDGTIDGSDFIAFINAFGAGC